MQTTSATWKQLWAAGAPLDARAVIAGTEVPLAAAPAITRAAMQDRLAVGNVASAALALAVRATGTIPRSAAVAIEARLNDGVTASEWLSMGTFYISRRSRDPVTGVTALECYDALLKANAVWTPSAGAWPRTMAAVLAELLTLLDMALDSRTVVPSGASFVISQPAEGTTIRDVLGTIAQAGGGNWIVTPEGKLRLLPLVDSAEAGEATEDVLDVAGVVGGMSVVPAGTITGVRCTADGSVALIGDDTGIVVDVSLTPLIAADMADMLIGQRYQAYTLTGAVCDPAAELGDYVRAGANGEVASALYGARMVLGRACRGDIAAPDAGEVTDEYPYIGGNARTLALAKAYVNQAVDALDDELTQQEIFNRLTDNGAAQGLVLYNGQLYVNASYIQAGTLTLGGANNVNGTMRVLNASGNVIGTWNNNGITIQRGDISIDSSGKIKIGFNSQGTKYALFNSSGMTLMLESGSEVKTSAITFVDYSHYPEGAVFGTLVAEITDGSEKWRSVFAPGYITLNHSNGSAINYEFLYEIGKLLISGPNGQFIINDDNSSVISTYNLSAPNVPIKSDLTSISATGTTNTTGATIANGTFFYLNGTLVRAKTDIANGASFTGANYETATAGGLNSLNSPYMIPIMITSSNYGSIYAVARDTSLSTGVYILDAQMASDNPYSGSVSTCVLYKRLTDGTYSIALLFTQNRVYVSSQLEPTSTAFTWVRLQNM